MTAGKFDVELFEKALRAGAVAAGTRVDERKLKHFVAEVAVMKAGERHQLFERRYLRDEAFREVWAAGGGALYGTAPKKRRERWPA